MATSEKVVVVKLPKFERMNIHIRGTAPLIVHRWSEKGKKQLLDDFQLKPKQPKEPKNPEREYADSLYVLDDGRYGFPASGFKKAIVRAGTYADMKMTFLRGVVMVEGEYIVIDGTPQMREDIVKIQMTIDLRYRGEFRVWESTIPIIFNAGIISADQILNLIQIAGFAVGIGEWRPEKGGSYGTFSIVEGA